MDRITVDGLTVDGVVGETISVGGFPIEAITVERILPPAPGDGDRPRRDDDPVEIPVRDATSAHALGYQRVRPAGLELADFSFADLEPAGLDRLGLNLRRLEMLAGFEPKDEWSAGLDVVPSALGRFELPPGSLGVTGSDQRADRRPGPDLDGPTTRPDRIRSASPAPSSPAPSSPARPAPAAIPSARTAPAGRLFPATAPNRLFPTPPTNRVSSVPPARPAAPVSAIGPVVSGPIADRVTSAPGADSVISVASAGSVSAASPTPTAPLTPAASPTPTAPLTPAASPSPTAPLTPAASPSPAVPLTPAVSLIPAASPALASADSSVMVFERAAHDYDAEIHGVPFFRPLGRTLVSAAGVRPGDDVVDLACGRGAVLFPAAAATGSGGTVRAFDLAPTMVELTAADVAARDLPGVEVTVADAANPPVAPGSADVVLCGMGLFLLPDPAAALARWRGLLRPGGRLAVSVFGAPDPLWERPGHPLRVATGLDGDVRRPGRAILDGDALAEALAAAGLALTRDDLVATDLVFRDVEHWWRWARGTAARTMLEKVDSADLPAMIDDLTRWHAPSVDAGGLHWRPTVRIVTATVGELRG